MSVYIFLHYSPLWTPSKIFDGLVRNDSSYGMCASLGHQVNPDTHTQTWHCTKTCIHHVSVEVCKVQCTTCYGRGEPGTISHVIVWYIVKNTYQYSDTSDNWMLLVTQIHWFTFSIMNTKQNIWWNQCLVRNDWRYGQVCKLGTPGKPRHSYTNMTCTKTCILHVLVCKVQHTTCYPAFLS